MLNIYSNEKKLTTKQSRSDIKKLAADEKSDEYLWGGLDSGRIALWDLRSENTLPEIVSLV